jgi:hypothetical protein
MVRVFLTIALVLLSAPSWACTCSGGTLAEEYADSAAVFKAVVVSNEEFQDADSRNYWHTKLRVQTVWKSNGHELDTIFVVAETGGCGTYLTPGVEYVLFAYETWLQPPRLETDACARNTPTTVPSPCHPYCEEHKKRLDELTRFLESKMPASNVSL